MPYTLEQATPRLYFVVDSQGKRLSKKPMYKKRARQQQKALYAQEGRKRKIKGGEYDFQELPQDDPNIKGMTPSALPQINLDDPNLDPTAELKKLGVKTTADISKAKMSPDVIKKSDLGILKNIIARGKEVRAPEASGERDEFEKIYLQSKERTLKLLDKATPEEIWSPEFDARDVFIPGEGGERDPSALGFNRAVYIARNKVPPPVQEQEDDSPSAGQQILGAISTGVSIGSKILGTLFGI